MNRLFNLALSTQAALMIAFAAASIAILTVQNPHNIFFTLWAVTAAANFVNLAGLIALNTLKK